MIHCFVFALIAVAANTIVAMRSHSASMPSVRNISIGFAAIWLMFATYISTLL